MNTVLSQQLAVGGRVVSQCHKGSSSLRTVPQSAFKQLNSTISRRGLELVTRKALSVQTRGALTITAAAWNPPTVADTKRKFLENYPKPIAAVYVTVIQELLVQQHLIRYNKNYSYDKVFGLGFVSVFDQILDSLPEGERTSIFNAYISALDEDPSQYRKDAEELEAWAKSLTGPSEIVPNEEGNEGQKTLADIAKRSKAGEFMYSKFFAIGLFRLLELTGAKDPKALEALVNSVGVSTASVNRDLITYKGVLSKLGAAKELMKEYLERERRKQAEREAEKASKVAAQEKQTADVSASTSS